MNDSRRLLQHFLAALAYRTQKALRGSPPEFGELKTAPNVRTPHQILWHMTGLIGYARTMFHGGRFEPPPVPFEAEVERFHETLRELHDDFANPSLKASISDEQFLQGPLADTMTHVGQLAMLRRFIGAPVASENFIFAKIRADNLSSHQPEPAAPDLDWAPDRPPKPPGSRK